MPPARRVDSSPTRHVQRRATACARSASVGSPEWLGHASHSTSPDGGVGIAATGSGKVRAAVGDCGEGGAKSGHRRCHHWEKAGGRCNHPPRPRRGNNWQPFRAAGETSGGGGGGECARPWPTALSAGPATGAPPRARLPGGGGGGAVRLPPAGGRGAPPTGHTTDRRRRGTGRRGARRWSPRGRRAYPCIAVSPTAREVSPTAARSHSAPSAGRRAPSRPVKPALIARKATLGRPRFTALPSLSNFPTTPPLRPSPSVATTHRLSERTPSHPTPYPHRPLHAPHPPPSLSPPYPP